jgi:glycosyltransferase involved in cell wall biosynthesis
MHCVRRIAEAVSRSDLGPIRLVTTAPSLAHEATQAVVRSGACRAIDTINTDSISPTLPYRFNELAASQYRATMALAEHVRAIGGPERFRLLFIPFIDSACVAPLALGRYPFGGLPFSGIAIHPIFHMRRMGLRAPWRAKDYPERVVYARLFTHPRLHSLFSIDPYFVRYARNPRVVYTPDPAEFSGSSNSDLRHALGIANESLVVLVYGAIDDRKGFDRLIRAVARVPEDLDVVVLAAGPQRRELSRNLPEPEISRLRRARRLVELARFIEPEEERSIFEAADVVWVCYGNRNLACSGVMVQAGQAGKPIIAPPNGILGETTRANKLGIIADADDVASIADAITKLAQNPHLRARLGRAGFQRFHEHTCARFVEPILERIRALSEPRRSAPIA